MVATKSLKGCELESKWYLIDATDCTLGRLAAFTANILRGKNKPTWTPNLDCGDHVIIINADKVEMTGNKWTDREYVRYTGFPGGQRVMSPAELKAKGVDRLIKKVVKGMLPKNRLGNKIINNLYVFGGAEHNMQAQQPKQIDINTLK
jgi:large subunit ribosomal protein L13